MSDYLGPSKDLMVSELPTLRSVLCLGLFIMEEEGLARHTGNKTVLDMGKEVYQRVKDQYTKANAKFVPPVILDETAGVKRVVTAWNNINSIVRKQKNSKKLHEQMLETLDHLFDIIKCHCPIKCVDDLGDELNCKEEDCVKKKQHKQQISCCCVKENKIPVLELSFVRAQRLKVGDKCVYQIGSDDKPKSKRQQVTLDRK